VGVVALEHEAEERTMTNMPDQYLADLMRSVNVDLTKALDDELVRVDPIESEPGEDLPLEPPPGPASDPGPIIWEDPAYPGETDPGPNYPPDHDPGQGPNPDEGYDPDAPLPDEPAPVPDVIDCPGTGSGEPFPEEDPIPTEPQPGDYPEDKNCWDPSTWA
jgi:hypothetical protein